MFHLQFLLNLARLGLTINRTFLYATCAIWSLASTRARDFYGVSGCLELAALSLVQHTQLRLYHSMDNAFVVTEAPAC